MELFFGFDPAPADNQVVFPAQFFVDLVDRLLHLAELLRVTLEIAQGLVSEFRQIHPFFLFSITS